MSSKVKVQKKSKKLEELVSNPSFVYANEEVKNYTFADHIAIRSFPRGMLFSFGKSHPETGETIRFKEILIPFDVATNLSKIIKDQVDQLIEQGLLVVEDVKAQKKSK